MTTAVHREQHFTASETVRDIVIGMSDGLTVPFAPAAGLSDAVGSTSLAVTAGMAEIAAGSIAMGLGGYPAARTDAEHFRSERERERREVEEVPEVEAAEVAAILQGYGLDDEQSAQVVDGLREDPEKWVDFMMRFELGLEEPDPGRARSSALTISLSYVGGGLIPLAPYLLIGRMGAALAASVAVTLIALLVFGYVKGRFTTFRPLRSAWQTAAVGALAAGAAFLIARAIA